MINTKDVCKVYKDYTILKTSAQITCDDGQVKSLFTINGDPHRSAVVYNPYHAYREKLFSIEDCERYIDSH